MTQSRLGSLIEAFINVLIGFGINFVANLVILPMYGYTPTLWDNFEIGLLYTVVSIARSYIVRRWFNAKLHAAAQRLAGAR